MISRIKSINPVYFLITFFFLFKLSHLSVPYFWDELGVYSRAALYMFDHRISLMPDALPGELSRGHPLLCAAIFAAGYNIIGPHVWVGHLTALLFSCALLFLLYRFAEKFFGHETAILAPVLLVLQPVFIAQSSMVLPEIMLSFFCTLSLYAYLNGRFFQLALFSTLAILVKETAVALPFCIGLLELIKAFRNGFEKKDIVKFCLICMPLAAWILFLVIQKVQNGWFFFPLHKAYVSFSPASIWPRLGYYLSFLLKGQGRYTWTIMILLSCLLLVWRNKNEVFTRKFIVEYTGRRKWQVALIVTLYILIALLVSILNFHLARYVLLVMPVLCMLVAAVVMYLIQNVKNRMVTVLILLSLTMPLLYYKGSSFNVDADMSYIDIVDAQKELTSYLNTVADAHSKIISDFPVYHGLIEKRSGYSTVEYEEIAGCSSKEDLPQADYLIFSHPGNLESCKPDKQKHELLKKTQSPFAKFFLYKNVEEKRTY